MKNKKLTYILLVVVAFIWYKAFVRISDNFGSEEFVSQTESFNIDNIVLSKKDSFTLNIDYKNPFRNQLKRGGAEDSERNERSSSEPIRKAVSQPIKVQYRWPNFVYQGLVKNKNNKQALAIVKDGGMVYNLREGEEIYNGIYLSKIWRDSVLMKSGKNIKLYFRK